MAENTAWGVRFLLGFGIYNCFGLKWNRCTRFWLLPYFILYQVVSLYQVQGSPPERAYGGGGARTN